MKRCNGCGEEKPYAEFSARGDRGGRPRSRCKACESQAAAEHARRNRAATNAARRARSAQATAEGGEALEKRRAYQRRWREENYARYRAAVEEAGLRKRYGMGRVELEAMLAAQGGKCLLCERAVTWETRHVDHIDTPRGPVVRGILCGECNTGLGKFREDAALLRRAAEYVAAHSEVTA